MAINPFQYLPIYGGDRMLEYHRPGNRQLPPHVFGVAAAAHKDMALTGVDQARACMHGAQRAEGRVQNAECACRARTVHMPCTAQPYAQRLHPLPHPYCPQAILISGESGAGKTEATKHCLAFLAEMAGTHTP